MKENMHIEKELLFKNNIKDITSISLDSDYKIEGKKIIGNFIIDGEYKIHEVSINKEKFDFKIPFNYELEDDIDNDSVKVDIVNFIYDYKKDELIVNIDYEITGDKKNILLFDNEESLDEFLSKREVEVVDTRIDDIKEKINEVENDEERKSIDKIEDKELIDVKQELSLEDTINNKEEIGEERDNIKSLDIVNTINNNSNNNDSFITYKIYKLHENETLESIVIKYHTTIDDLKEYNDLNSLSVGDKIIIPTYE